MSDLTVEDWRPRTLVAFRRRNPEAGLSALCCYLELHRSGVGSFPMDWWWVLTVRMTEANSPSLCLFERLGFSVHHEHVCLGASTINQPWEQRT